MVGALVMNSSKTSLRFLASSVWALNWRQLPQFTFLPSIWCLSVEIFSMRWSWKSSSTSSLSASAIVSIEARYMLLGSVYFSRNSWLIWVSCWESVFMSLRS